MKYVLWFLQIVMGVYFVFIGYTHFNIPENLPAAMSWMYDLSPTLHYISGTAEILGGLGLILPAVTRIQTRLVPLAASGLVLVMIGAMIYHVTRAEYQNIVSNLIIAAIAAFIVYGRWKMVPHVDRNAAVA